MNKIIPTIAICGLVLFGWSLERVFAQPGAAIEQIWQHSTGWNMALAVVATEGKTPALAVAAKAGGIQILSETTTGVVKLAQIRKSQLGGLDAMNLYLKGNLLFVVLGDHFAARGSKSGLAIIDVSQPESPRIASVWQSAQKASGASGVVVHKGYAYLAAMKVGVHVLDVRDPTAPKLIQTVLPDINFPKPNPGAIAYPNARGVFAQGDKLFVANDAGGFWIYDISNAASPRELGRYANASMNGKPQAFNNIIVHGNIAFVAVDYCGLEILDVSDTAQIKQLSWLSPWGCNTQSNIWFNSPGHTNQLSYDATQKRLYLSAGDSELLVVDVKNPTQPALLQTFGGLKDGAGAWGILIRKRMAYLTYIRTPIPFRGRWAGVKALRLPE